MATLELVRHAAARSRREWWNTPDRQRPLDDRGVEQAAGLVDALRDGPEILAVWSSPFTRCVETVAPLAASLELDVRTSEALAEATLLPIPAEEGGFLAGAWFAGRSLGFVDQVLAGVGNERVVACSHGDVVTALLAALIGRDELTLDELHLAKGAWCTIEFRLGRSVTAVHHPAPGARKGR